jgi:hypothetical protein
MRQSIMFFIVVTFILTGATTVLAADWTFMVYIAADNNLESAGIDDFLEMATIGSDPNLSIVVQFDRIPGWDTSFDNWTTCKRYYITPGMVPDNASALADLGEINMGDPVTLTNFIDWATVNYPADNYALVLWDHGSGWRKQLEALVSALNMAKTQEEKENIQKAIKVIKHPSFKAVCWDESHGADPLYMREVKNAANAAIEDMDLIGFDACLMGMVEVAYEVKDIGAGVMVGSEEVEPLDGWPYDTILDDLADNTTWNASQLGRAIVDNYYASYGNSYTQAAIDLSNMNILANTISDFAETMRTEWDTDEDAVKAAAGLVMNEINNTVIHEQHGSGWPGAFGLAIYFPEQDWQFDNDYNGAVIDFPNDTSWEEFISEYYNSMAGSWIEHARVQSQEFQSLWREHIDLYSFCVRLVSESNMIVVLDRTGSMTQLRYNGHSRCADALSYAISDVVQFFANNPEGSVAVFTFTNEDYTNLTGGFVDEATALAALNALDPEGCSGSTPLSEAMCDACDYITAGFPEATQGSKIIAVSSDGGENNSNDNCFGPFSISGPPPPGNYDAGSWQAQVWNKFQAQAITNIRYWGELGEMGAREDIETGKMRANSIDDAVFFQDVAESNGGEYELMSDSPPTDIPTLSEWGLIILALLLLTASVVMIRKRQHHMV